MPRSTDLNVEKQRIRNVEISTNGKQNSLFSVIISSQSRKREPEGGETAPPSGHYSLQQQQLSQCDVILSLKNATNPAICIYQNIYIPTVLTFGVFQFAYGLFLDLCA